MNFKLIIIIIFHALIPVIYTTARIHFLDDNTNSFDIVSQINFLQITYEVLQESLIAPLFFILREGGDNESALKKRVGYCLSLICCIYLLMFLSIYLFTPQLVSLIKQKMDLFQETVSYLRWESFNFLPAIVIQFFVVLAIIKSDYRILIWSLTFRLIATLCCDIVFLKVYIKDIGVNGIAYGNVIVNCCLICLFAIRYRKLCNLNLYSVSISWFKECLSWGKSAFSKGWALAGLESFIRNSVFFYMVLLMVNTIGEQSSFWLAITFLWSWLLLPIVQFGEYVKNDVSMERKNAKTKFRFYMLFVTFVVIIWLIFAPFYEWFFRVILKIDESHKILKIVTQSLGFYIIFAYGFIITSIFYGIGAIRLCLYQSLIVNVLIYGGAFVFYKFGVYNPTLSSTIFLFGGSMVVGTVINFLLYFCFIDSFLSLTKKTA